MTKRGFVATAVAVPAVLTTGVWTGLGAAGQSSGNATTTGFAARLNAAQEVPKPAGVRAGAQGAFVASLVRSGTRGTLTWRLTFQRLTGKAAAAHIHLGARGRAGAVRVALCGPCRSGSRGTAKVDARTITALLAGRTYVNVHTGRNPAGEIRGQVAKTASAPVVTPPPTTTTSSGTTTDDGYYPGG